VLIDLVFALQFTPISSRNVDLRGDPVPEPGTLTLLYVGLLGLGFMSVRGFAAELAARAWIDEQQAAEAVLVAAP
jgi:hypothetical protein